jgi:glutathione S-transferase
MGKRIGLWFFGVVCVGMERVSVLSSRRRSQMSLDFYYAPMSTATPVHWALEELGIAYDKVLVDLEAGEQRRPQFLSINPNGKVPVIMHDGVAIFESAAIMIYLGETFGTDRGLFPSPGPARGEAMKWIVWCNVSLGEALSRYLRNTSDRYPTELRNRKVAALAKDDILGLLGVLDSSLTGEQYLVENRFSLADLHASAHVGHLAMRGLEIARFPAIMAWKDRCLGRPAYARIMGSRASISGPRSTASRLRRRASRGESTPIGSSSRLR